MPLEMNREVFITCAVTGSGGTQDRSPKVPRSPQQIADSAIAAAKAGAAIVHCHVRDPETGAPARDLALQLARWELAAWAPPMSEVVSLNESSLGVDSLRSSRSGRLE